MAAGAPEMTELERRVTDLLARRRGRSKAVPVPVLARAVGLEERELRRVVKHLIERHRLPIGASSGRPPGYYLIASADELDQTRRSLLRRATSILRRARAYDRAGWVDDLIGQLRLFLGEDDDAD